MCRLIDVTSSATGQTAPVKRCGGPCSHVTTCRPHCFPQCTPLPSVNSLGLSLNLFRAQWLRRWDCKTDMIACLLLLIGIYSCRACASTTTAAVASRTVLAAPCLLQEISKARRRLQRRLYNFLRMVARGAVATMLIFVVAVAVTVRRLVFVQMQLPAAGVFGAHMYGWPGVAVVGIGSQRPRVACVQVDVFHVDMEVHEACRSRSRSRSRELEWCWREEAAAVVTAP